MASISLGGKVTGKQGEAAVTVREFGNGGKIAKFSVVDSEYFYSKDDEKKGQFYSVEVTGKAADIVADRLERGRKAALAGNVEAFNSYHQAKVTSLQQVKTDLVSIAQGGTLTAKRLYRLGYEHQIALNNMVGSFLVFLAALFQGRELDQQFVGRVSVELFASSVIEPIGECVNHFGSSLRCTCT